MGCIDIYNCPDSPVATPSCGPYWAAITSVVGCCVDFCWPLWLLVLSYGFLGLVSLWGSVSSYRSKIWYRTSFLGASSLFCWSRFILFFYLPSSIVSFVRGALLYLLTFLPIFFQYWAFSLLILFVFRSLLIVYNKDDKVRILKFGYHGFQVVIFALTILASFFVAEENVTDPCWDRQIVGVVSFFYLLLTVVGSYCYVQLYRLLHSPDIFSVLTHKKRKRLQKFLILIPVFIAIFFCRFFLGLVLFLQIQYLARSHELLDSTQSVSNVLLDRDDLFLVL